MNINKNERNPTSSAAPHTLIIAEKVSVGRSIASVLGVTQKRDGYIEGGHYLVAWCAGHLLELAAPDAYGEQYAKWRYEDLPIIPDKWKHVASKGKTDQLKILTDLMKRPDVACVINACDAGREGELIFRLVYEHANCKKPLKRLWISSMEDAAIKAGFDNIKDSKDYDNLYAAAACRERADWLVGISATRLFSVHYKDTLNTGRVQSPTLAMLVKRDADIAAFVKEPFFTPVIDCGNFTASGEKIKDKQAAEVIRDACNGKTAVVRSVKREKKTITPPKLYDLTTLQREANRLFGFTAQQTLDTAQSLYEKKLLTYPRVDSRYLTADMRGTAEQLVEWVLTKTSYKKAGNFTPEIGRLINDSKVTDHHAIIPTVEIMKADFNALPSGERDLLKLVTVRLLCAAAAVHSYEAVTAVLDCNNYPFTAKGKTVLANGWKEIETIFKDSLKTKTGKEGNEDDAALPELTEGQLFENVAASVKEGASAPPKAYTEDTLLSAMENAGAEDMPDNADSKGLGTPATRAGIIEKLIKTGFVMRQKKNLIPSEKGKNLITILPEVLKSPKLTAEWEHMLLQIQRGEVSGDEFMNGIASFTADIVKNNNAPNPEYIGLFSGGGNGSRPIGKPSSKKPLGKCPRCGADVREGTKGFFCDTQVCGFKLWKASRFWTAKKKPLTATIVKSLLKDKCVTLKGLHSEKTGKEYDAVVVLDDGGGEFVNFKMEFGEGNTGKRKSN